jgi:hypothetical protein
LALIFLILWNEVLVSVPVLVLEGGHNHLASLPRRLFQSFENRWRRLTPLGYEDDERQRFARIGQQPLKVGDHRVHEFFAKRWIGFERSRHRLELENRPVFGQRENNSRLEMMTEIITPIIIILPSRSKVAVRVGESGGKLAEVAVER